MNRKLAPLILLSAILSTNVYAETISLCTTIDSSGSIFDTGSFDLEKGGVANAIEDPTVIPQDSSVYLSVVLFGTDAEVIVTSTLIDSQATASNIANSVRGISQPTIRQATNGGRAIELCTAEALRNGDKAIIDIVTDGAFNVDANGAGGQGTTDDGHASSKADAAISQGVFAINLLGVGESQGFYNLDQLRSTARPQPASTPPNPGFVTTARDFNEFQTAIKDKFRAEVNPPPITPTRAATDVPIFGPFGLLASIFGLLWFGNRRRKS